MVHATIEMLNPFAAYLPDMDILLNLNDEPRVAIPWDAMSEMRSSAKPADFANGHLLLTNGQQIDTRDGIL
jgi:hypothetical protein